MHHLQQAVPAEELVPRGHRPKGTTAQQRADSPSPLAGPSRRFPLVKEWPKGERPAFKARKEAVAPATAAAGAPSSSGDAARNPLHFLLLSPPLPLLW